MPSHINVKGNEAIVFKYEEIESEFNTVWKINSIAAKEASLTKKQAKEIFESNFIGGLREDNTVFVVYKGGKP